MDARTTTPPSIVTSRRARSLALIAVLAVALAATACGSARAAETTLVAPSQVVVTPTPLPTTAPIILPPDELELPAVAALPDALVASPTVATLEPIEAASPTDSSDPTTTAPPTTASSAEPVTAEVEPTPASTGTITPASADHWDPCVVSAAQNQGSGALLDAIASAPATDVSSLQLNGLAAAAAACGTVAQNLAVTDLAPHLDLAASCMNQWLASDAGGSVFVGLTSIGWGVATPDWAAGHLQASLQSCFSPSSFAAVVMADVATEPRLAGAFDSACLAASFDQAGVLAAYANTLATAPGAASLSIGLADPWVLGCANVGQMVAVAAADDGVALSGSTIACIDAELTSAGLVGPLIAGTADNEAVGVATIACLSDAEAAALLG